MSLLVPSGSKKEEGLINQLNNIPVKTLIEELGGIISPAPGKLMRARAILTLLLRRCVEDELYIDVMYNSTASINDRKDGAKTINKVREQGCAGLQDEIARLNDVPTDEIVLHLVNSVSTASMQTAALMATFLERGGCKKKIIK